MLQMTERVTVADLLESPVEFCCHLKVSCFLYFFFPTHQSKTIRNSVGLTGALLKFSKDTKRKNYQFCLFSLFEMFWFNKRR